MFLGQGKQMFKWQTGHISTLLCDSNLAFTVIKCTSKTKCTFKNKKETEKKTKQRKAKQNPKIYLQTNGSRISNKAIQWLILQLGLHKALDARAHEDHCPLAREEREEDGAASPARQICAWADAQNSTSHWERPSVAAGPQSGGFTGRRHRIENRRVMLRRPRWLARPWDGRDGSSARHARVEVTRRCGKLPAVGGGVDELYSS